MEVSICKGDPADCVCQRLVVDDWADWPRQLACKKEQERIEGAKKLPTNWEENQVIPV